MTQDTQIGNNGHKGTFTPDGFNPGTTLRPGQSGSDNKYIMTVGKDLRELIMKGDFADTDVLIKFMKAIYQARKFKLEKIEGLLWDIVAGMTAIKGKRTDRFVTAQTGVWLAEAKKFMDQQTGRKEQK
jgi:hypothetical protein